MSAVKVSLRKRTLPSGKITLYLDFYPAIFNAQTGKMSRREYLGIYLNPKPRTPEEREVNKKKLLAAEGIRSTKELELLNSAYGFVDRGVPREDFLAYFHSKLDGHNQKWIRVYDHFKNFCDGKCQMKDITVDYCNAFRTYLLNANQLKHPNLKLKRNSASGYWSTFRGFLAIAWREKKIRENVNEYLDSIDAIETHREFLTQEELDLLAATPCVSPVLKAASLFSCLTGLRFGDIRDLKWENFATYPDGGHCIRITTEKTETSSSIPVTDEAYLLCGPKGRGTVFKGFTYALVQKELDNWIKAAGIEKHITFHCFRHTNATLLLNNGTDIYTVSKMLTHKNVSTTQIYTEVIDDTKRKAAESIHINSAKKI